jgi:hypothetical protein
MTSELAVVGSDRVVTIEESQQVKNRNLSRPRGVSDLYFTANWPARLFFFSTLFATSTAHPVENLCAINRAFM